MTVRCSLGHENPDGSMFCDECGESLAGAAPTATTVPPVTVATPMAAPDASDASNEASQPYTPSNPFAAPASAAPKLTVESDGAVFDLAGKTEALIGREDPQSNNYPDVDLTNHGGEEGGVSRKHARLLVQGTQVMIEDLDSVNGTFVGKQKLEPKTPIAVQDGSEIRLGRVALKLTTA